MKIDTLIKAVRKLEMRSLSRTLSPKEERQLGAFFSEAWDKLLYKPNTSLFGIKKTIGKHKLPRYMYHITTEEAYLSMLKDGKIIPSQCMDSATGTFLFDMKNFTRFWRKTKCVAEQPRTTLLNEVVGKLGFQTNGNVVMLRIPTASLDARKIRIRRQNICRCGHGNMQQEAEAIMQDRFKFSNALENLKYTMQGENIANVPRYNQRKLAVEFVTPEEIPINEVSLVGKTSVNPEAISKAHWDMTDLPDVWKELTKGAPEHKAFEYMV